MCKYKARRAVPYYCVVLFDNEMITAEEIKQEVGRMMNTKRITPSYHETKISKGIISSDCITQFKVDKIGYVNINENMDKVRKWFDETYAIKTYNLYYY